MDEEIMEINIVFPERKISKMDEHLIELYMYFAIVFTDMEKGKKVDFSSKRNIFYYFVKVKELCKTEKTEFIEKLVKVYEKYGVEMFRDSLIPYVCLIQIHKYLNERGVEVRENDYLLLNKKEIMNNYENTMQIDELIENNQVLGDKEINPYRQLISSMNTTLSYVIDVNYNLYSFGGLFKINAKKIMENVKHITTDFEYLVGINSEGQLWYECESKRWLNTGNFRQKTLFSGVDYNLKFVKLSTQKFKDGTKILLALSECGGLYQFSKSWNGFYFEQQLAKDVVDISGHDEVFGYVKKDGKMYVRGYLNSISIPNSNSDTKFINIFDGKVKRIFVFENILFGITEENSVFCTGKDYKLRSGTGLQPQPMFSHVKVPAKIIDISCSSTHTLFLSSDGQVYGCGLNDYGQIAGLSDRNARTYPALIEENVNLIMAGLDCSFMINEMSSIYALGKNTDGRFGVNTNACHKDTICINLLDGLI